LRDLGADVCVDNERTRGIPCVKDVSKMHVVEGIDLLIVIGGDGTILRAVREMQDFHIPILSINRGTVGFLAETQFDEVDELLPVLLTGGGVLEERTLLDVLVTRGGKEDFRAHALNEAVIAQGTISRLVDLPTTVNGEELTTFHADGLIIATPTGSTAYSLAAGGPVVHPTISATILTPINPHSFSQKPIVIPGDATTEVHIEARENKFQDTTVILTVDGQVYHPLQQGDTVSVNTHEETVKFLRRKQDTFFSTIREKLKWGETVDG
jgi:NAD+ kinase